MKRTLKVGLVLVVLGVLIGALGGQSSLIWFLLSVVILLAAFFLFLDALMHAGDEVPPTGLQASETLPTVDPGPDQNRNPETAVVDHQFSRRGGL